ncbi:leucine-rich repeat domain-containing protein [Pseudomonas sp. R1-15]|uniref:leucine-rich repeat domain-containing protein n=1 Tax=Pseudomonas sp. R1-15 TaxID=2817399 RepID=UPI003DA8811C
MSVLSEENAGASLAADADPLSIAAVTSRVEYTGQLEPDNPGQTRQDSSLETQWIRQLVACYPAEIPSSLAHPITPDTLIPVMYWSTLSTYQNGTEHIDLVPLWMLASGEMAFLRTYLSTPPDDAELATTLLGSAQAPYRWHMKIFWGDEQSAGTFSDYNRKQLADAVPADVLGALAGLNDGLLQAIRQGMPHSYNGFASLAVGMDCGTLEQELRSEADDTFKRPERQRRSVYDQVLEPVSLLPNGLRFRPHKFAGQWLAERGLSSDAQVRVNYQEVETIDSASASKGASVPLLHVVTQGFLSTHQSKDKFYASAASAREGWRYPHISQMTVDFSSLQVNGRALAPELLRQLQEGVPPGYQGPGQSLITDVDEQGKLLGPQEKARLRQMELLDLNQVKLARLFAGLPTFDSALKNRLVRTLGEKFEVRQFQASLPAPIDPDNCYVNHFVTDSSGGRSLTSSQSFTEVIQDCLQRDAPPHYLLGEVGFFSRPDSVSEEDSVFADPVDAQVLRTMESVFYFPQPTTNVSVRRQLRDDLSSFCNSRTWGYLLEPPKSSSAEAALAYLLAQRFLHLLNLHRADQEPATQLTRSARVLRAEEDRLLDLITTHPSLADRNGLLRTPVPHVYAVMLDMGSATTQKWPAAMVIKVPERRSLFLYSLEGGIQRFGSFQALVSNVHPLYKGEERTIQDISTELSEPVFVVAANDLLQLQRSALEAALTVPDAQAPALDIFARSVEDALALPMLGLSGPLTVRQETLVENNRPNLYKTAAQAEKNRYRLLEEQVLQKANNVGKEIPTLWEFTRQKVKEYVQENLHPAVDFDPDKTLVTLASGTNTDPGKSRTTNLTQWMLDNLRPRQYPSAMRDVQPIHLTDQDGRRVRNPANGYFYTLTGIELARMTKSIDAGGSYELVLVEALNKPDYKAAWQAAYLANMRFKGYEAALRGNEAFKVIVKDEAFNPPKPCKQLALWLDAVLKSSSAQTRARVGGKKVHVHALLLGGSLEDGRSHGSGGAASIEGALILSDRQRPEIEGTVGVYFPDSPDGNDFHEFSDLSDGVARLLLREEWYGYFRSRISLVEPEEIKRILGRRGGRPFVGCSLIDGDFLETLHRAHVSFHRAHTAERSTSNRDVQVTFSDIIPQMIGGVLDVVSLLLVPGYLLIKRAITISWAMFKTGLVPLNAKGLKLLHLLESTRGGLAGGMTVPLRGQSSFLAVMAGQSQSEGRLGLPLEEAVYRRYAVTDASPIRGLTPDAQGFYRVTLKDSSTGRVTARPVYIQQRDGTVFRVHDHTRLTATEANIVDPVTGLSIRSSGVTRNTVARMPDGDWRAVGFGRGGAHRSLQRTNGSVTQRLKRLYPAHTEDNLSTREQKLGAQALLENTTAEVLVTRLEKEWATLDEGLRKWQVQEGIHHPAENSISPEDLSSLRMEVAKEIRRAWRSEPHPEHPGIDLHLVLTGWEIGRPPPITARFEHIEELHMDLMGLSEDPSDFLRLFPNIDTLSLNGNSLTVVPAAVGELRTLSVLSLGNNPLEIKEDMFAPLLGSGSASSLLSLDLSGLSSGGEAMVAAIGRLAELPALRALVWADNLHFTPQSLQAITALPRLRSLDLRHCGLRLNEQGSAFLRTATVLEELVLSGNNCLELPNLSELAGLRILELANAQLDRVPELALAVLSKPSHETIFVNLSGNRITHLPDELFARLRDLPAQGRQRLLLDDNPLQSAQIQALRAVEPGAYRNTVDVWLDDLPDFQRALEVARDDVQQRNFINWFSDYIHFDHTAGTLEPASRDRASTVLEHYISYANIHADLRAKVADFDLQLGQLRDRLQARISERETPDLHELGLHFLMFESALRARLEPQGVPFASFLYDHYDYWDFGLLELYPEVVQRQAHMTPERFIDWLSGIRNADNIHDLPSAGEITWRPYLGLMSDEWVAWGAAYDDLLVNAPSGEPIDPSRWPGVLLDNLAMLDVNWAAGPAVTLTDGQLLRTLDIFTTVKTQEFEPLARRVTTEMVTRWWPRRPSLPIDRLT